MEIGGIIFYSFAISSLTAIIQKFNKYDTKLRAKLDTLEDLKRECDLGPGLYDLARQSLVYESNEDQSEAIKLIQGLPYRLRVEISTYVMKSKISGIKFFKDKPKEFLAFVIPLLKPRLTREGMYVFREGDTATSIYFLLSGKAGYCIEVEKPFIYIAIKEGETFGYTDLIRTQLDKIGKHKRKFSVIAVTHCEMVRLSIDDIKLIKSHFPEMYDELFKSCNIKYKKVMFLKKR